MKQTILLIALCLNIILWFTANGRTEDNCCCTVTCQYETVFGTPVTKNVDTCWKVSQIPSCTPNEACIKSTEFGWIYTNEYTGTCSISEPCIDIWLLGSDNPQLDILREFRDEVLAQTPEGQEIIRLYYEFSPMIARALEEDEQFRGELKLIIDGVLQLIMGAVD